MPKFLGDNHVSGPPLHTQGPPSEILTAEILNACAVCTCAKHADADIAPNSK